MILQIFHPWTPVGTSIEHYHHCDNITSIRQWPTAGCMAISWARRCLILCDRITLPWEPLLESPTDNCLKGSHNNNKNINNGHHYFSHSLLATVLNSLESSLSVRLMWSTHPFWLDCTISLSLVLSPLSILYVWMTQHTHSTCTHYFLLANQNLLWQKSHLLAWDVSGDYYGDYMVC